MKKTISNHVIFDHLPKTAGMTVNRMLINALGDDVVTQPLNGEHNELIRLYGDRYSVICAHVDFSQSSSLNQRYDYITLFRDPVDRLISHFFFILNNHTITDLPVLWPEVDAFVKSDGDVIGSNLFKFIDNPFLGHFSPISSISPDDSLDLMIEKVITTLGRYSIVGFYDLLPCFIKEVGELIGCTLSENIPVINPTNFRPKNQDISAKLLNTIECILYKDIKLYRHIRLAAK